MIQTWNFFSQNVRNLDTVYHSPKKFHEKKNIDRHLFNSSSNYLNHKEEFWEIQNFLSSLDFTFHFTWALHHDLDYFSNDLPYYTSSHQKWSDSKDIVNETNCVWLILYFNWSISIFEVYHQCWRDFKLPRDYGSLMWDCRDT